MANPTLSTLPTEMVEAIFRHLDPHSLIFVSQTSRRNHEIAQTAGVWRAFCRTQFRFWSPRHDLVAKLAMPTSAVDWRALYLYRRHAESETKRLLNKVLESQQNRVRYINEIADLGYDAKEALLKEYVCADDAEDVLARRYYAKATLERIQRELAINVWKDLSRDQPVPMERAMGAYDVFTRFGEEVDFDTISDDLDRLANRVLDRHDDFNKYDTRNKAFTLATFMREEGFKGVSDVAYRALGNSFIGLVLRSESHESLPLISVVLYCALASRLGIDARPVGFVFHVYCIVYAPPNHNLNGEYKPSSDPSALDSMYLDPFRSSSEIPLDNLTRQLREMGVPASEHRQYLSGATTRELVLRTARNIMNSVQTIRQNDANTYGLQASWQRYNPDMDSAFYSTLWAFLILGPGEDGHPGLSNISTRRRQYLPYLLEHLQTHFPWDATLLQQHVIPLFIDMPEGQRLINFVQSMQTMDAVRKPPNYRTARASNVKFKIGQLFKHRRYRYEGIVTGWDTSCDAGEEWIRHMGVDRLSNGRHQSFYHVLVADKSVRYVAEENIAPVADEVQPSDAIMQLAGRHFKRWDEHARRFVSNVADEYPDD